MAEPARDTVRRRLGKAFDEAAHPRDAGGRWVEEYREGVGHLKTWIPHPKAGRWTSSEHALDHAASFPAHDARKAEAIDKRLDEHLGGIHAARKQIAQHVAALKDVHKDLTASHKGAQKALSDLNDLLEKHGYEGIDESEVDDIDDANGLRAHLATMFGDTHGYLTPSKLQDYESTDGGSHIEDPIAALEAALRAHTGS